MGHFAARCLSANPWLQMGQVNSTGRMWECCWYFFQAAIGPAIKNVGTRRKWAKGKNTLASAIAHRMPRSFAEDRRRILGDHCSISMVVWLILFWVLLIVMVFFIFFSPSVLSFRFDGAGGE